MTAADFECFGVGFGTLWAILKMLKVNGRTFQSLVGEQPLVVVFNQAGCVGPPFGYSFKILSTCPTLISSLRRS